MASLAQADSIRIASFNTELHRKGPGLLLRDLRKGAPDIDHVLARLADVDADIWVLQDIDYDAGGMALSALAELAGYPYRFALAPNAGLRSGEDLDGNGRIGGPRDAQGYGWFSGQGGMAILSRYPVTLMADETARLWADQPWAALPQTADGPFLTAAALAVQRLSSVGQWAVRVDLPGGALTILTAHATTPVFDGPEDRNGLRNADEIRLLREMLEDVPGPALIAGDLNLDPGGGEGRREVIRALLAHPRLRDPHPGQATVDFGVESAGKLRVSYVLPTRDLIVDDAGVAWSDPPARKGVRFTRHHPVWVDITLPR